MGPGQSKCLGHSENSAVCSNQERRGGGFVWGDCPWILMATWKTRALLSHC